MASTMDGHPWLGVVAMANRVMILWLIVTFGDDGRCQAWFPGTGWPNRGPYEAFPGHNHCTPWVTTGSTVSSGSTRMTTPTADAAACHTRSCPHRRC